MSHRSTVSLWGLLLLAGSASAATVGPALGRPAAGRALEVSIPFTVDEPSERACASANVRYGNGVVPRSTLHVQGRGLRRNLLVTSRVPVTGSSVTVNAQVGCGARAVSRRFVIATNVPVAKGPPPAARPGARVAAFEPASRRRPPPAALPAQARLNTAAMSAPAEPLFPPPGADTMQQQDEARAREPASAEELQQARTEAAAAMARLEAVRKELAAVLDVERRTSQTLIDADRQVRDAKSEAARLRQLLNWVAAGLGLAAAGLAWFEFNRLAWRRRSGSAPAAAQEPTMLSGLESPA